LDASSAGVTGWATHPAAGPSPVSAHSSRNGATGRCRAPSRTEIDVGSLVVTLPAASTSSVHSGRIRVSAIVCGSPGPQLKEAIGLVLPPSLATATEGLNRSLRIVSAVIGTP